MPPDCSAKNINKKVGSLINLQFTFSNEPLGKDPSSSNRFFTDSILLKTWIISASFPYLIYLPTVNSNLAGDNDLWDPRWVLATVVQYDLLIHWYSARWSSHTKLDCKRASVSTNPAPRSSFNDWYFIITVNCLFILGLR